MIRKREADAVPLLYAEASVPGRFVASAQRFLCSKGYDMLNVDISHHGEVVARYFADPVEDEYKAHLIGENWKRMKLVNIIQLVAGLKPCIKTDPYLTGWYTEKASWEWDEGSEEIAKSVLHHYSVGYFENEAESDRYRTSQERRYNNLQKRLNRIIRPAPDGFESWVHSLVAGPGAVRIKEVIGVHVYQCTECLHVWSRKRKFRNRRTVTCPHCGKELTALNDKESETEKVYLFQTAGDGSNKWYERYIWIDTQWTGKEWDVKLHDMNLAVLSAGDRLGDLYFREYMGYTTTSHNGALPRMHKGYIYPDFGGAEKMMTGQQAHCLRYLADRKIKVDANKVIIHDDEPVLEYLLKCGLHRMAMEVIDKHWYGTKFPHAETMEQALRVDKQRVNRLKQINGSFRELDWLRYEQMTGRKVSAEDLQFFMKHGIDCNDTYRGTRAMLSFIPSPTAFRHYLEKQAKMTGDTYGQTIETYYDYIRMADEQGLNLASEIFYKPKNLADAHNACVRVAHEQEYEIRAKEVAEKFPGVTATLQRIREKYEYDNGTFAVVMPENILDIIAEGRALGHCIDTTDRYFERIQNDVTYLGFLRRSDARQRSWYTLEFEPGGTVRQQRTTGNNQKKADTEEYMPFIREWQRVLQERMDAEDLKNAEKSKSIRLEEYKELREKRETVRNGLLAGKLLVDVLEADLVEAM